MAAELIDGKRIAQEMREGFVKEVEELKKQDVTPGLAVVLVGENPASTVYVNMKKKACQYIGIYSEEHKLTEDTTTKELLKLIHQLNFKDEIDGILVQLPLPKQIDEDLVLENIDHQKDVDGFHPYNMGLLLATSYKSKAEPLFMPCTPYGIMKMLEYHKVKIEGKNAVILGDRLDTDVAAGNRENILSILVLTGVTSEDMILMLKKDPNDDPNLIPRLVINYLKEIFRDE